MKSNEEERVSDISISILVQTFKKLVVTEKWPLEAYFRQTN